MNRSTVDDYTVSGEFITLGDERFYEIKNVNKIAPFFISVVSNSDHWLFVSSTGGVTAGRVSPDRALFPYITVDKVHESTPHTGSKMLFSTIIGGHRFEWEPFNKGHDGRYASNRNIYKNVLGNKLCFEEVNHDLGLTFRYCWTTSDEFGFVRQCELENFGEENLTVEMVDGIQNILPAGTPLFTQTNVSNLVDAYKWSELDKETGLAFFTLNSGISDRAEPCESLRATTVFCLGLGKKKILLSSNQLGSFRRGIPMKQEIHKRGTRGAYLVNTTLNLAPQTTKRWRVIANIEQSQAQSADLRNQLRNHKDIDNAITRSVEQGTDELGRIMGRADAFQTTAEETVTAHHYANVLFNVLRGGIFDNQYQVSLEDFSKTIQMFNRSVYQRHRELLHSLPEELDYTELVSKIRKQDDPQLDRLTNEYLPITFGRRHGDPSRPWNMFSIKLHDEEGNHVLSYEGNWRDIFQNWEALVFSYPEFTEPVIAKFVNASTMDGYNPYRITKEGIDWEVEDPEDPWSYIGYWGDHQIIYLLKLLELSRHFHPQRLSTLLHKPIFCYANVPYKIKPFEAMLLDAKDTVEYDNALAKRIDKRVADQGADGKLVEDANGEVYQVNLLEKLLVTLLCKLGNFVIDGGIWLNTQRPEWNDANNALVGQGLSMVTLCYMRRYVTFLQKLLADETGSTSLSCEVGSWLTETAGALSSIRPHLQNGKVSGAQKYQLMVALGQSASRYRETVYQQGSFTGKEAQPLEQITALLGDALAAIDHSIAHNLRKDGLYNAYNLLNVKSEKVKFSRLYPMLEGQVAALSSGSLTPDQAVAVLEKLFDSKIYREDQKSFMLYPDRRLPRFLEKNRIPAEDIESIPLLKRLLENDNKQIAELDVDGCYRFNADFREVSDLDAQLDTMVEEHGASIEEAREPLRQLYEKVFNHKSFTGRSGGMFGYEGLGCIYWHMVSKLLLAVQENFFIALSMGADKQTCNQIGSLYYRVREGISFNKTPVEYGAFPTDPYSHTPKNRGAKQPGMTGQVKEEILTRFGELGIRVSGGEVRFETALLRACEFTSESKPFSFLDVDGQWQQLTIPESGLAFTWCQVPFIYRLDDSADTTINLTMNDGGNKSLSGLTMPSELCSDLFERNGRIRQVELVLGNKLLFRE